MDAAMLWEYNEVKVLRPDKLFLVKQKDTGAIAVKKYVRKESISIYQALKEIKHPNLPEIYGCFVINEQGVVLREYIEGASLQEQIADEKIFDKKQIKRIVCELCDALAALHDHSPAIIHRDIKPSNILIEKDGTIKLIDFDAARFYNEQEDRDTELIGTHGYAAPEQYGFSQSDARADIFAVGVLLEKLSKGNRYYADVIAKCKSMEKQKRYAGTKALKKAIRRYVPKRLLLSAAAVLLAAAGMIAILCVPQTKDSYNLDMEKFIGEWGYEGKDTTIIANIDAMRDETGSIENINMKVSFSQYVSSKDGIEHYFIAPDGNMHHSIAIFPSSSALVNENTLAFEFSDDAYGYGGTGTLTYRHDKTTGKTLTLMLKGDENSKAYAMINRVNGLALTPHSEGTTESNRIMQENLSKFLSEDIWLYKNDAGRFLSARFFEKNDELCVEVIVDDNGNNESFEAICKPFGDGTTIEYSDAKAKNTGRFYLWKITERSGTEIYYLSMALERQENTKVYEEIDFFGNRTIEKMGLDK